ncbi:hypothetical protein F5Y03DRAFT_393586 [Xylaria venustula]|nr:hypothetical protein F5Y03DRAFT_393586 [Xylaria venustula]
MPSHRAHVRSSRRVPPLTDKDIDHEISLVDRDESVQSPVAHRLSLQTSQSTLSSQVVLNQPASNQPLARSESRAPLTQNASEYGTLASNEEPEPGPSRTPRISEHPDGDDVESSSPEEGSAGPSQDSNPQRSSSRLSGTQQPGARLPPPKEIESEIDILYENQRGGFLCGIPLFSSAALGNLDPPAWTNFAHKPSPTDIHTAQVPDPSWQWAWPEWRINHDDQIQADSDGWEYSFMFSKKFSWHSPKWYSSFVRRRAWIRRRIKVSVGYQGTGEQVMNPAYFTVATKQRERSPITTVNEVERPSMDRQSRRSQDGSRSRERSRGDEVEPPVSLDVKTTEDLMVVLRQSRIDRERLEAVENYINNCTDDLLHLQDHMHEIMSMLVFQTSRKTLLAHLTELHDLTSKSNKGKSAKTTKTENLAAAIKHADEEVRKLEFWSDIKGMAENGETIGAVDHQKGWDSGWQGLDKSGAKGIDNEQIP